MPHHLPLAGPAGLLEEEPPEGGAAAQAADPGEVQGELVAQRALELAALAALAADGRAEAGARGEAWSRRLGGRAVAGPPAAMPGTRRPSTRMSVWLAPSPRRLSVLPIVLAWE